MLSVPSSHRKAHAKKWVLWLAVRCAIRLPEASRIVGVSERINGGPYRNVDWCLQVATVDLVMLFPFLLCFGSSHCNRLASNDLCLMRLKSSRMGLRQSGRRPSCTSFLICASRFFVAARCSVFLEGSFCREDSCRKANWRFGLIL